MPENNLKRKATSGMVWTTLQTYSNMFLSFVSGIILARLLMPYDYACIGMLAIFMVLAEAFIDGGFGSALIQKKSPTQEDYSTIFWWNLFMAVLMYAILYASAPAIARFYDIPILSKVLRVQGVVLFIYAFNIVQRNQLRKKLNFKVLSIVSIATSLISLGITIWMAAKGYGVWALVMQNILSALVPALVFWFIIKWRPLFIFSRQSFKDLFGFGSYMFLTSLLNRFSNKIQGLLIGKVYSPATLGYFSKAHNSEKLISSGITQIMNQITYPLYAEVQHDNSALINILRRLTSTLAYLSFPLIAIVFLLAKPLFLLLYSERWLPSVPYFQVLCLAGVAYCLQSVNNQSLAAIGKSKLMFIWTVVKRVAGLSLIVGGLFAFGMKGLLVGVVLNTWFSYFVNISLVSKYIGYKWYRQLQEIIPPLMVCFIGIGLALLVAHYAGAGLYVTGLIELVIFAALYMLWSLVRKPSAFLFVGDTAKEMLARYKEKKR